MQLRQIEVFHAFMITGSTVGAAKLLNVTQPAVSTTLKRLQDESKVRLFQSSKGRLLPTPEAHMLFRQVRAIHEDILQLKQLSDALADGKVGHVRFGVVPALGESIIANAIAAARHEAPDLQISVEVLNSYELIHMVQSDRLDFACIFGPLTDLPVEVMYRRDVELMCVGPAHMLGAKPAIALDDYARYPLALMRPTDPIGRLLQKISDTSGVKIKSTIELRNCRAAIAFAKSGVALGIADAFSIEDTDLGSARAIPFDPPLHIELAIVFKEERLDTVAQKSVVRAIKTAMAEAAVN